MNNPPIASSDYLKLIISTCCIFQSTMSHSHSSGGGNIRLPGSIGNPMAGTSSDHMQVLLIAQLYRVHIVKSLFLSGSALLLLYIYIYIYIYTYV